MSIPLAASACPVEYVDMHREWQPSSLASTFNHASNAHPAERLATLIDEYVGRFNAISLLLPLQELETVHLIPFQVMDTIRAPLSRRTMMVRFGTSMSSQRRSQASETRRPWR